MTQPQTETKLIAKFKQPDYRPGVELEIKNVQEAVNHGTQYRMGSFQTHKIGEPENVSGTHYLSLDRVVTAADGTAFFTDPWGERIELGANDKAYNRIGRQIWPQPPAAPASNAKPSGPRF